jgi:two-component system CheB/CheR fusion protein
VPCALAIETDGTRLELMLRTLLGNALKYTPTGSILLGCRRHGETLCIEVWDTGIGIEADDLERIFGEYQQIRKLPRERQGGLGLGLSIVQRLAVLLGHRLSVRSRPGRGSVFALEANIVAPPAPALNAIAPLSARKGRILVIEDDADLRDMLLRLLTMEGHDARGVADGLEALTLAGAGGFMPQLVLADFNLPGSLTGLQTATQLRQLVRGYLPVLILTGDISPQTQQDIARLECVQLHKPVKPEDLMAVVQQLLPARPPALAAPLADPLPSAPPRAAAEGASIVHVVDDDPALREVMREMLEREGYAVLLHATAENFLAAHPPGEVEGGMVGGCLLIDVKLPGMDGYDMLRALRARGDMTPAIMITGFSDVPAAVRAIKAGAADFVEKPVDAARLLAVIGDALAQSRDLVRQAADQRAAAQALDRLTERQREVMERVLAGEPSKNIAADLGISQRTVEAHRAAIMRATGTRSLPALARLAMAAAKPQPEARAEPEPEAQAEPEAAAKPKSRAPR